jgi:hypothetical protein
VTGTVCDGHAIAARLEITDGQALPGILARTVRPACVINRPHQPPAHDARAELIDPALQGRVC